MGGKCLVFRSQRSSSLGCSVCGVRGAPAAAAKFVATPQLTDPAHRLKQPIAPAHTLPFFVPANQLSARNTHMYAALRPPALSCAVMTNQSVRAAIIHNSSAFH